MVTKKRDNAVAYKPLINTDVPAIVEKVDNLEIQNYEEPGVAFHGYARIKTGQTQYKLLKQERYHKAGNFALFAAGSPYELFPGSIDSRKTLYLTNICISTANLAAATTIVIADDTLAKVLFSYNADVGIYVIEHKFVVPAPVTTGILRIFLASNGTYNINIDGFLEEKP